MWPWHGILLSYLKQTGKGRILDREQLANIYDSLIKGIKHRLQILYNQKGKKGETNVVL